ncbi:MAG: DUF721 domain-containing protein, partial [Gammaproteobacteria bacterium]|nr:DUF721 domain-containing protein [Gammaproteobacteria bacterium]
MNTQALGAILQDSATVTRLLATGRRNQTLAGVCRDLLAFPLSKHVVSVNLHDQTLVLNIDDPVWATRARLISPDLVARLAEALPAAGVSDVRIRVSPPAAAAGPAAAGLPAAKVSDAAATALAAGSRAISDPDIKEVLQRLASR